jgi:hypothetical protein
MIEVLVVLYLLGAVATWAWTFVFCTQRGFADAVSVLLIAALWPLAWAAAIVATAVGDHS